MKNSLILAVLISLTSYSLSGERACELEKAHQYHLTESESETDELLRILVHFRNFLLENQISCPSISELMIEALEEIREQGYDLTDEDFETLMEKVKKYEKSNQPSCM